MRRQDFDGIIPKSWPKPSKKAGTDVQEFQTYAKHAKRSQDEAPKGIPRSIGGRIWAGAPIVALNKEARMDQNACWFRIIKGIRRGLGQSRGASRRAVGMDGTRRVPATDYRAHGTRPIIAKQTCQAIQLGTSHRHRLSRKGEVFGSRHECSGSHMRQSTSILQPLLKPRTPE